MFENFITNEYLRALVVFILFFAVLRGAFMLFMFVAKKLTAKTKGTKDDELLEKFSIPLTIVTFLLAVSFSIDEISFATTTQILLDNVINSVQVITFAYLVYAILDVIFVVVWSHFAKKTKTQIDDILGNLVAAVLKAAIVVLALILILDVWGVDIGPFLAGLGIAGLAIAFALQSTLANIFAGISMIFDKTIREGDVVSIDDVKSGKVKSVGLRATRIITFDNETLIVPNSKMADSVVHNVALPGPKTRVVVPFGVAYGSDVDKIKKLILKEIKKVEHFDESEDASVKFLEMADSSLNFKAYFYVKSYKFRLGAVDEANTRIYKALNKAKIEIPFPQMDVHVKKK